MIEAIDSIPDLPPETIYIAMSYLILFALGFNSNV